MFPIDTSTGGGTGGYDGRMLARFDELAAEAGAALTLADLLPAVALAGRPAILLADEPPGNLDSTATADVLALFDELHASGRTIVLITHEADVARRASRIIRLRDGQVELDRDQAEAMS